MRRLIGKTALITAAGQGIGRETALLFATEGAKVWATDIELSKLEELTCCERLRLDVRHPDNIAAVLAQTGPLDILFNCAGYVANGTILDCDESDWARSLDLNVTGAYRLIRAALPAMLARGGGSIINMSSVVSSVKGVVNRFAYGASKAAVIGLTKAESTKYAGKWLSFPTSNTSLAELVGGLLSSEVAKELEVSGPYTFGKSATVAGQQATGILGSVATESGSKVPVMVYIPASGSPLPIQEVTNAGNTGGSWTSVSGGSVTDVGSAIGVNAKSITVTNSTLQK